MFENNIHNLDYSILVNSTDAFADCWNPFFSLFKRYWPDYQGKIYLNSETKSHLESSLEIISLTNDKKKIMSWSDCLIYAINKINNDIILYLQEDYFIKGRVNNELTNYFYRLISSNTTIGVIHLTDQATPGPFEATSNNNLVKTKLNAPSLVSTQAAFWRKDLLLKLLSRNETAWQFEHYGTKRARLLNLSDSFYNINPEIYGINKIEIIPYVFTGIIKSQWNPEVVNLFKQHYISIDFSQRGFINNIGVSSTIFSLKYLKNLVNRVRSEIRLLILWLCRN